MTYHPLLQPEQHDADSGALEALSFACPCCCPATARTGGSLEMTYIRYMNTKSFQKKRPHLKDFSGKLGIPHSKRKGRLEQCTYPPFFYRRLRRANPHKHR